MVASSANDQLTSIEVDSDNNIIIAGYSYGNVDGNNLGSRDIIFTKFSSVGVKQWTKQIGTSDQDFPSEIKIDSSNNIVIVGWTLGTFGENPDSGVGLSDNNLFKGNADMILTKYNSSGTKQWAKQFGLCIPSPICVASPEYGRVVDIDSGDNIMVGGTFGGTKENINLNKFNSDGIKQDDAPHRIWKHTITLNSFQARVFKIMGDHNDSAIGIHEVVDDDIKGIAFDSSNNLYVTGETQGGFDGILNNWRDLTYPHEFSYDVFLMKYNSSGTRQWSRLLGAPGYSNEYGQVGNLIVDSSGNSYFTFFGRNSIDGTTAYGGDDIFLAKYDTNGTKQWVKSFGTSSTDTPTGFAKDSQGNFYITGYTSGAFSGYSNSGQQDTFIIKTNSSGILQWVKQFGSTGNELASDIAIGSDNYLYVSGSTAGSIDGKTNLGDYDIFLMKFDSDGN
jgi:hypothetical protein